MNRSRCVEIVTDYQQPVRAAPASTLSLLHSVGQICAHADGSRRAAARGSAASAPCITVINEVPLSRLRLKSVSLLLD